MSLLDKIFHRRDESGFAEGVALFEQGDFTRAIVKLRSALDSAGPDSGSLMDFYLRQSLVKEGRRLLKTGSDDNAVTCFAEATERWPKYPDLHFWHGIALASTNAREEALTAAREALRFNNDYVEARLLEAGCLSEIGDKAATAESLNALLASGRRVEHALIRYLADDGPYTPETLPTDLSSLLNETITEKRDDEEVTAAIELCRSGDWEEGIPKLEALCEANPTYPDYRVKLAGALFQTGRNSDALDQVGRALILNPRYRTAAHLKALVLADQHRFAEAREVIQIQSELTDPVGGHPGEALFCSYLGAVISLLTGRRDEARNQLQSWGDLLATFPTAELLRAACDDLDGCTEHAHKRLEALADKWFVDADYHYYLACHNAGCGRWDRLGKVLESWPRSDEPAIIDERHAYLSALLKLSTGQVLQDDDLPRAYTDRAAWKLLDARSLAIEGKWLDTLHLLDELVDGGVTTETLAGLIMQAYLAVDETGEAALPEAAPDSLLRDRICFLHRQERTGQALARLRRHRELHPADLRWTWLDPTFWLDPVRRWIG
ncbi:tetratricopeptide repeat protein [bacterium]|nr:tetratricopeptide repeat protein [bacterium]